MLRFLLTSALLCVLAACTGAIGDAPDAAEVATPDACAVAPARGQSLDELRRLSRPALANTLSALLGKEIVADAEIASSIDGLPSDAIILAGDFHNDPPIALAGTLDRIAKRAAVLALASATWRAGHLPACAATAVSDDACARSVIGELGAHVFRRDLDTEEVSRLMAVYRDAGAGEGGLSFVLRRLLQSPTLAFHIETGAASTAGAIRLTDFEVASRISYFTGDTMPDDELLEAARGGGLQTLDGVAVQVRRLLDTDTARAKVRDFFRYYAHLGNTPDPLPASAARVGIGDVRGLGDQMREEAYDYFDAIFWGGGTFADLMTSTAAFPRTPELAKIFGTEPISAARPVANAPNHVGLLHRPVLIASPTKRTSPIVRGAHLRKLFLCESLGMPPTEDVMERQAQVGDLDDMSNRERVTTLTNAPKCTGCHTVINATGFAFEGFDTVGVPRTQEVVLDESGDVEATWPIDTTVDDAHVDSETPRPVADSRALAQVIAESQAGRECIARRLFEYYRADVTTKADACTLSRAHATAGDGSLQSILVSLIASDDIFWRKEPGPQ